MSTPQPLGNYGFAPGIPPYSAGVVAEAGFAIRHVALRRHLPWMDGLAFVEAELAAAGRPMHALCGVELRSPEPHSFDGFGAFNATYINELRTRGLLLTDDVNPIARTNVAPVVAPPTETLMAGFSYTVEKVDDGAPSSPTSDTRRELPDFVIAGAGDLVDQADLRAESIVAAGDLSPSAMAEKVDQVMTVMEERLEAVGRTWADVTVVNVYAAVAIHPFLADRILARVGSAAAHGIHWHLSHPPIAGLSFEMDVRSTTTELWR